MRDLVYKIMQDKNDADIPKFLAIYQLPEIAKYISISDNYFHYVISTENVCFYKVYESNKLVGSIHIEKQADVLCMDILVFPEYQRMGLGAKIIADIQEDIFGLRYNKIDVDIDENNIASLNLFTKQGFVARSKDGELINYIYERQQ